MRMRSVLFATSALPAILSCGSALAQPSAPPAAVAHEVQDVVDGDELVVTGSRIARSGFDAPTPTKILTSALLEERGVTNVGEFLNEVPAFRSSQSPQTNTAQTFGTGATFADLRSLGNIRTLTLVDSRRFVPTAATGQVDLNLIPTILVDRVDVVTGGASAAYGSDAVSGVVNIILDKRLDGIKGDFSTGISQYGDNAEKRGSLAFGGGFGGGRGHVVIGGEYVKSDGVGSFSDRDWGRRQDGLVSYTGARPAGTPSRFYAPGVSFINMAYGGLILGNNADTNAANGADVLRGIQFGPGGAPTSFSYGDAIGTSATNFSGGNPGLFPQDGFVAIVPVTRRVVAAHVDFDVTDDLSMFVEGNYGRTGTHSKSPPVRDSAATGIVIQRDNAFLPASIRTLMLANNIASFGLGRANNDLGVVATDNTSTTERLVAGFEGKLGGSWRWDAYYEHGRNTLDVRVDNLRIEQNSRFATDAVQLIPGGPIVCRDATARAAGCVPINLFGAGSPSAAAIDYVTGSIFYKVATKQDVAAGNLQGEPFSTWAGPVSVAVGGEYRKESVKAVSDELSQRNAFNYSNPKPFAGSYDVKEAYLETIVPLAKDVRFARSLELNAAIRYTDYSTSGGVTTWKVGATYEPISDIRFRATRSRDIRAPNNSEIFSSTSAFGTLRNPFSGATSQIVTRNLSSPTLKPERADTSTVGVVLSPSFIEGLRLSADFYDIKIDGAIAGFNAQTILDNCASEVGSGTPATFCSFVDRTGTGASTVINSVSVQLLNIASIKTRGIDFEASYRFAFGSGTMSTRLFGNYTEDLISDDGTGAARTFNAAGVITSVGSVVDRAGQVGGFAGTANNGATNTPHWTLNGTVSYAQDPWAVSFQGRYIGGGVIDKTLVGPGDEDYDPASPISIGGNRIPARFYLSMSAQVDVIDEGTRKLQLYGVINNLTNIDPPFPTTALSGLYDRAGRSFKVGVRFAY